MDERGTAKVVASVDGVISSAVRRRTAELLNWTSLIRREPVSVGGRGGDGTKHSGPACSDALPSRLRAGRTAGLSSGGQVISVPVRTFRIRTAGDTDSCGYFECLWFFLRRPAARAACGGHRGDVHVFYRGPAGLFSSNLKPYSSDVATTLAVLAIAHVVQQSVLTRRSVLWLAILGVVVLFFSQAAMVSLTAAGAAVLLSAIVRSPRDRWHRVAVVLGWGAAVVGAVAYGLRSMTPVDYVYLHRFWEPAFMPTTATVAMKWLSAVARAVFSGSPRPDAFDGSLQYAWPALFATLLSVGALMMCFMKPAQGILVVGPIVLAAVASAMGIYPVGTRVSLFLVPLLLLIVVFAADSIGRAIAGPRGGQFACLLLIPFAIIAYTRQLPPQRPEHLRPVMQYVAAIGGQATRCGFITEPGRRSSITTG